MPTFQVSVVLTENFIFGSIGFILSEDNSSIILLRNEFRKMMEEAINCVQVFKTNIYICKSETK